MTPQRLHAESRVKRERDSPIFLATGSPAHDRVGVNKYMNNREIQEMKKQLRLTKRQRHILVGLLLGDGHLETQDNGRTYRLKVEHSIRQKEYVQWLYEEFKEWVPGGVYIKQRGKYKSIGFTTYSHGAFRFYGQQFYSGKVKRVPGIIKKLITPLGIAIWFMDDGSRKSRKHHTYNIHTLGYKKSDLVLMQKVLSELFGIDTSLHRQKKDRWRIYILSRSAKQFTLLVKKYLIPSMEYKLTTQMPKE